MSTWIAVAALGAVSYALRCGVVLVVGDRTLPGGLERFVTRLAPAVLAAMVVTSLVKVVLAGAAAPGSPAIEPVARVAAVAVGGVVAVRSGSVGRALVGGLVTYALLARVLGA